MPERSDRVPHDAGEIAGRVGALLDRKPINPAPPGATTRAAQADLPVEQREESIMSTPAAQERQHLQDLASASATLPSLTGQGTINYIISISETPDGFAQLSWYVSDQYGTYCTGPSDWVGVFANCNLALVNPNSNVLDSDGSPGWVWAAGGPPFTTTIPWTANLAAAYVIKNASGNYVTVAAACPPSSSQAKT
jgi:hypothetical protein